MNNEPAWLPDGEPLPNAAVDLIPNGARIHLRLTSPDRTRARGACDGGLGEWWTGRSTEVTCPACLEVVHA